MSLSYAKRQIEVLTDGAAGRRFFLRLDRNNERLVLKTEMQPLNS